MWYDEMIFFFETCFFEKFIMMEWYALFPVLRVKLNKILMEELVLFEFLCWNWILVWFCAVRWFNILVCWTRWGSRMQYCFGEMESWKRTEIQSSDIYLELNENVPWIRFWADIFSVSYYLGIRFVS